MGMLDTGKSGLALLLSLSGVRPQYMAIGSGSGAFNSSQTGLVYDLNNRMAFTNTDISVVKDVTFTGDWGATTMSGLPLREFAVTTGSSGGTIWSRDAFPAVTFDGSNELQIQVTFRVY